MKRTDFEAPFQQLGLKLSSYEDAAYFAETEHASLSLHPFSCDVVARAKLTTKEPDPRQRAVIVNTFLSAAKVEKTPEVEQALKNGEDFRTQLGSKTVSFTSIGSEYFLNVFE